MVEPATSLVKQGGVPLAPGAVGRERKRRNLTPWYLIAPSFLFLVPVPLYLMYFLVRASFFDWDLNQPWLGQIWVGLGNYRAFFHDADALRSVWTAVLFTLVLIGLELVIGIGLGLLLQEDSRVISVFRGLFMLPLVVTPVVIGLLWRFMYNPDLGILNYFISALGFGKVGFLIDRHLALWSIVLAALWQNLPFMTLVVVAGLKAMPVEPFEAAMIDGASGLQAFRYITLPLLRPLLLVALLIRFIDAFKTFDLIYIMTSGGPGTATQTISMLIYREGFAKFYVGYASMLTIILLVIVNIFAFLVITAQSRSREKEATA